MIKFDVIAHVSTNEDGSPVFVRRKVASLTFDNNGVLGCKTFESASGKNDGIGVNIRGDMGILIQSTECFDKEGREIYQCDVVEDEKGVKWEVVRFNGSSGIVNEDEEFMPLLESFTRNVKVIGNRAEEPTFALKAKFEEGKDDQPHEYLIAPKQ